MESKAVKRRCRKGAWERGFACLAMAMSFEAKAEKSEDQQI
jgi:hypothetical protein